MYYECFVSISVNHRTLKRSTYTSWQEKSGPEIILQKHNDNLQANKPDENKD